MNKKSIILWVVIGTMVGVLIIQPIAISLYLYNAQDGQGGWLTYLGQAYHSIFSFNDLSQLFMALMFSFLGIALLLKVMAGKMRVQLVSELTGRNRVLELIKTGKNKQVEFQSALRWNLRQHKRIKALELETAKTIAGFMNTGGGNLVVGVDDKGQPLGLKEDYQTLMNPGRSGFEQHIMQLVNSKIGTTCSSLLKVDFYKTEGKDFCHITINPSKFPVYIHKGDRSHFYIRSPNGTRELDILETLNYIEANMDFK